MAQRNSGYVRRPRDLYETPPWVTRVLVRHLRTRHANPHDVSILEPAAGTGAMVRGLKNGGFVEVYGSDVEPHEGLDQVADFLSFVTPSDTRSARRPEGAGQFDAVVTNPPYDQAPEFIDAALRLMQPRAGLVAMLLRSTFDSAKGYRPLFGAHPAWGTKIVLLDRIKWFEMPREKGERAQSPSETHAWYVWDWRRRGGNAEIIYDGKEG